LSVARGLPWFGRETTQGHVLYAASGDELQSTRSALLSMGWNRRDPLDLIRENPDRVATDPDEVLNEICERAKSYGSVLIILDMLFDFAGIKDEMSYAQTRRATAAIQRLGDQSGAHVAATHHSPKYMLDVASAGTAALGSQGIAARFSPIVLTRHFGETLLYTIESTKTRDPRGLALTQTCVTLNQEGWAVSGGPFKPFMRWVMYSDRVMELFEGGEPGVTRTVNSVAKDLDLGRVPVQNTLYQLSVPDPIVPRNCCASRRPERAISSFIGCLRRVTKMTNENFAVTVYVSLGVHSEGYTPTSLCTGDSVHTAVAVTEQRNNYPTAKNSE
jgi:hypothetical protein